MRKILAAAAVAFLAVSVFAQSAAITGTVTDESGGTLPGATVVVTGPGGSRTGYSGSDGKYSIVPTGNGPYKVSVSMPSFASQHKDGVAAGADSSFTMKIAGLGETVVVSASKVESTLANAPVTMSVVSAATLATAPSQNFGDILRNVPGVNVIQTSARDVNLSMRQGTSTLATSTLVLLDGRSIYLDFFGFVLWDLVPSNPSDIKQIEVVRGPASAVWGANALTGVVNILTKTPRENPNTTVYFSAGTFGTKGGSRQGSEDHYSFGGGISFAKAINDKWSTRLIAGYVNSDPYSRPTGRIPVIQDPRVTGACNGTPGTANCIGGLQYPLDGPGAGNFENDGTKQPKFDVRLDQDMSNGGRLTYSAGYSGTTGIIHTGIGPFNIQSGSYLGYGRIGYSKGALKVAAFGNLLDVEAPNLLLIDPNTLKPVDLNFKTQTYDFEIGHSKIVAEKHVLSYGGNARRNQFDITLAPGAEDRNEFGGYFQDEFFVDKFRLTVGGRVDKFGNIDKAVFSPRVTAMFKPTADQSFRVSFNKAFRSPSAVNNYLNQDIFTPTTVNLSALAPLAPLAPAAVRPALTTPFNFIVKNVGNPNLKQESVTAYEVAYTGTFKDKTTIGIALYRNETDDNINFASIQPSASFPAGIPPFDVYTPANAPAVLGITTSGVPVPGTLIGFLNQIAPIIRQNILLPRTVSSYLNLGPLQQDGLELSIDHRFDHHWSVSANYSYQKKPKALTAKSGQIPYLNEEVALPAKNRFNASINWNTERLVGTIQANYQDKALWTDVLTSTYHGYTESFTMVNGNIGVKWNKGKVVTTLKGVNLLDKKIQQHVFGDVIRRSVTFETRLTF
ncbi:MAG: TonB-dependent receptor [Vicinamibacteria bacterium]|nr:TonB-dependent receptor [Vicinamibacteria bacterium]